MGKFLIQQKILREIYSPKERRKISCKHQSNKSTMERAEFPGKEKVNEPKIQERLMKTH